MLWLSLFLLTTFFLLYFKALNLFYFFLMIDKINICTYKHKSKEDKINIERVSQEIVYVTNICRKIVLNY